MIVPKIVFRLLRIPPRIAYAVGLGPVIGRVVLLLTTTGRVSGKRRVTPLQYEEEGGAIIVGSVRGAAADWYRNILADPRVWVRVRGRRFQGIASPCDDPEIVADFLALRFERRPRFMRRVFTARGYPAEPTHADLLDYAQGSAIVTIRKGGDRHATPEEI